MRTPLSILLLATLASFSSAFSGTRRPNSIESQSLPPDRAVVIQLEVRAFTKTVAHDVTQDGPLAWRKFLEDTPSFFMAVNGGMAFADSPAATAGIQAFAPTIKQITLEWGDDLRVDPIAQNFAIVATTYHEIQIFKNGKRVDETGFFTGTTEYREGRWQFRNAHWSEPLPSPPAQ
jgi:hypothetical protein